METRQSTFTAVPEAEGADFSDVPSGNMVAPPRTMDEAEHLMWAISVDQVIAKSPRVDSDARAACG